MSARLRRLLGATEGNIAIEFALVAPILLLVLVGTVDFGLACYYRMATQHAAQIGAEHAALHGFDAAAIGTAMRNATAVGTVAANPPPAQSCGCVSGIGFAGQVCGTTCPDGGTAGNYVTVTAELVYTTILPYPGIPESFTFSEASFIRVQ